MYYENINDSFTDFLLHLNTIMIANGWTVLENGDNSVDKNKKVYESGDVTLIFETEFATELRYKNYVRLNINIIESGNYDTNESCYNQLTGITEDMVSYENPCISYQTNAKSKTFISVNSNRLLLVLSHKGEYQSFYVGRYLQYADPSQHPYPHIYSGCKSFNGYDISTSTGERASSVMAESVGSSASAFVKDFNGDWVDIYQTRAEDQYAGIYPWAELYGGYEWGLNIDGSYTVLPSLIFGPNNQYNVDTGGYLLGEMEGLFGVSSMDNSPENTFIVDGDEYICFTSKSSVFLTGVSQNQYYAMKKV